MPQPGIAEIEELVATTRRAGADVRIEGELPTGIDPAAELTAYRVVQEAVSNAVRHAPGALVLVTIRGAGGELVVTVTNGPGSHRPATSGSGHGLVGMRERVSLLNGTLRTVPTADGGFLVEAVLPLNEVPE